MMKPMKKRVLAALLAILLCASCAACGSSETEAAPVEEVIPEEAAPAEEAVPASEAWLSRPLNVLDDKYRTYYEVFVYSFYDSDGDVAGVLNGSCKATAEEQALYASCNPDYINAPSTPTTTWAAPPVTTPETAARHRTKWATP